MKLIAWIFRGALFIALFGLAIKNSNLVELRFYLDGAWQAPLSVVILVAFAAGAAVGLTTTIVTLVRQGRELKRLRRDGDTSAPMPGQE